MNLLGIDKRQERNINILFVLISILGASATIWWVLNEKRHSKLEEEIFALDKEIKLHQLRKIKNNE